MKHFVDKDKGWMVGAEIARDLPYDYVTFCDNLLDLAHIGYTHFRSLVKVIDDGPITQTIMQTNTPQKLSAQTLRPNNSVSNTNFVYPCQNFISSERKNSPVAVAMSAQVIPVEPGKCKQVFSTYIQFKSDAWQFKIAKFMIKRWPPKWWAHQMNQNVVLDDDLYFLHKGERYYAKNLSQQGNVNTKLGQIYSMPHKSDVIVNEFRGWLNKYAGGGPFGPMDDKWLQRAGPIQNFDQVYERYYSHTKQCKFCSDALRNI